MSAAAARLAVRRHITGLRLLEIDGQPRTVVEAEWARGAVRGRGRSRSTVELPVAAQPAELHRPRVEEDHSRSVPRVLHDERPGPQGGGVAGVADDPLAEGE